MVHITRLLSMRGAWLWNMQVNCIKSKNINGLTAIKLHWKSWLWDLHFFPSYNEYLRLWLLSFIVIYLELHSVYSIYKSYKHLRDVLTHILHRKSRLKLFPFTNREKGTKLYEHGLFWRWNIHELNTSVEWTKSSGGKIRANEGLDCEPHGRNEEVNQASNKDHYW